MSRKKETEERQVPTFDCGNGVVISATDAKDAGHKLRGWAERFRHPESGAADDSEETTQRYLEAYATAHDMDVYNGLVSATTQPEVSDDDGA